MAKVNEINRQIYIDSAPLSANIRAVPSSTAIAAESMSKTLDIATRGLMHINEERRRAAYQRFNYMFESVAESLDRDYENAADYQKFDQMRTQAFDNFKKMGEGEEFFDSYLNRYGAGIDEGLKANMQKQKAKKETSLYSIELDKTLNTAANMAATASNLDERNRHLTEAKVLIENSNFLSPENKQKTLANFAKLVDENKKNAMENLIYNDLPKAEVAQKNNFFEFDAASLSLFDGKIATAKKEDRIKQKIKITDDMRLWYANIKSYWNQDLPIPPDVIASIPDKDMLAGIKAKDFAKTQGGDVSTDPALWDRLNIMADKSPAAFKTYNLYRHIGFLADDDLAELEKRQAAIKLDKDGNVYQSEERSMDAAIKGALFDSLGIKNDPTGKLAVEKLFRAELAAAETEKGRKLTLSEQSEIMDNFTKKVSIRGSSWFDVFRFNDEKPVGTLSDDDTKKVYIDFDDIDDNTKKQIGNVLTRQGLDLSILPSAEQKEIYEDVAGVLKLPTSRRGDAARGVFKCIKDELYQRAKSTTGFRGNYE